MLATAAAIASTVRSAAADTPQPANNADPKDATAPHTSAIADGVFVHQGVHGVYSAATGGDLSNAGFIIGRDAVAIIDTGGSAGVGRLLLAEIKKRTDRPVRFVINTHMHLDHVLGNAPFRSDATTFVAHAKMARGLAARADRYLEVAKSKLGAEAFAGTEIVLPTVGVADSKVLDLGDRLLTLTAHPTAHTDNDLTIRDEKTGTVFLGDLLFAQHTPSLDGSIAGWLQVLSQLKQQPANRVVPGHGPAKMAWPSAAGPLGHYLQSVADGVRAHIRDGKSMIDAQKDVGWQQKDAWLLFKEYHARNVSAAYAELEWE